MSKKEKEAVVEVNWVKLGPIIVGSAIGLLLVLWLLR